MVSCVGGSGMLSNSATIDTNNKRHNIIVWGVAFLILVYIGRIQEIVPFLSALHIGKIAVFFALALLLLSPDKRHLVRGLLSIPQVKYILGISFLGMLSIPYSYWPAQSAGMMVNWLKALLFIFLLIISVHSLHDARKIVWAFILTVTVLLAYSFINPKMVEGVRISVTGTYDTNDFALLLVMSLPMMFYLMVEERSYKKLFLLGVMAVTVLTILKTGSRGGLLSLAVVTGLILYRKGLKYSLKITPLVIVAAIFASFILDESHMDRFKTILEPTKDYNVTERIGRFQVWQNGLELMLENPILGVGAAAFPVAEGTKHEGGKWSAAHNAFIQIGAELGVGGLLLFSLMILRSILFVRKYDAGAVWFQRGLEASLCGFCVGGFFLSWAYSYVLYFFIGLTVVYMRIYYQALNDKRIPAKSFNK